MCRALSHSATSSRRAEADRRSLSRAVGCRSRCPRRCSPSTRPRCCSAPSTRCRTRSSGADGKPVNALLGTANLILREVEIHRAARRRPLLRARRRHLPDRALPRLPRRARGGDARRAGAAVRRRRATSSRPSAGPSRPATTSRPTTCSAPTPRREAEAGGHALLLTGDRDMYQCAGEGVTVLYVRTGGKGAEEVGPAEVRERYGIDPELVPDFIALRGDPSDGLPGRQGRRPEDRGRAAARARLAGGGARQRDPRARARNCAAP